MNLLKILFICCATLAIMTGGPLCAATPEESFQKSFPHIRTDSIQPTAVPGLYEIVSGGRIAYYAPGPEYLITGAIMTRDGKNLTEERVMQLLERKLKEAPLDKALKIGGGPHTVIEITDPDCTYCRRASTFLSARNDVTRYVLFFPLAMHKNAPAKVRYILCAEDRVKTYEEAMAGKLDDMKFTTCKNAAVEELMETHKKIGDRIGVTGTPLFLIDGQVVGGADIPRMEKILGDKNNKPMGTK
jgi:thiol:disulfide interchange protein DsbC